MFRFVILTWDPMDGHAADEARALSARFEAANPGPPGIFDLPGVRACWTSESSGALDAIHIGDHGVVLGTLFTRTGAGAGPVRHSLSARESDAILRTRGEHLIDAYWGRYVAVFADSNGATSHVMSDPSGTLPCFHTSRGPVRIFFSRADDCHLLGVPLQVNWDAVAACTLFPTSERLAVTCLSGIDHVQPGQRITSTGSLVDATFLWDPRLISATDPIEDRLEAASILHDVVSRCVQAWAACYDGVLLRLSGGLDSSIVACCLGAGPNRERALCYTHHSPGVASDERDYARAAANAARLPLIEYERSQDVDLSAHDRFAAHPVPTFARYAMEYSRREAILASKHGARAIFSGELGDVLFYISQDIHSAVDYVWTHGLGPRILSCSLDAARREGKLFWRVLRDAARAGMAHRSPADPWLNGLPDFRTLVPGDVRASFLSHQVKAHPWREHLQVVPPGKMQQIIASTIHEYQPFYDPVGKAGDPHQVSPLNSQPVIELCLRIPTYLHTSGGWDRAIARRAFLNELPRKIATRRTKGENDDHLKAVMARNLPFIRSRLLEGQLVGRGLLDAKAVEEALSGRPGRAATAIPEIYWYLCIELWLQGLRA